MDPSLQRLNQHDRDKPYLLRLAGIVPEGDDKLRHHVRTARPVPQSRVRPPPDTIEKTAMNAANAAPVTKRRCWRAFLADRQGATAVEFALVAVPFLGLIFGILQTFLVFFSQQLLETAVNQSSRLILTGQAQAQSMTQSQFAAVVCSNLPIFINCNNLMIDVEVAGSWTSANADAPTLTLDANGNVTNI